MRYLVKPGDTLSAIAKRRGITVDAILAANPRITNRNKILAGKTINVPSISTVDNAKSLWSSIKKWFRR